MSINHQESPHKSPLTKAQRRAVREAAFAVNGARAIMANRLEPADSLDPFFTPPFGTRALVEHVLPVLGIQPIDLRDLTAWEHAAGEGYMAEPLAEYFGRVIATDVHPYGYAEAPVDFLSEEPIAMLTG
jgi:hypothetical protein